jgi:hypothetical protein
MSRYTKILKARADMPRPDIPFQPESYCVGCEHIRQYRAVFDTLYGDENPVYDMTQDICGHHDACERIMKMMEDKR